MKSLVRRMIRGTPLEAPARALWHRVLGLPPPSAENRLAARAMRRVLRRDSNCADIGASYGELLDHMLRLAPHGRHFAFEAIPASAAHLRAKFPNVTVMEVAVSDVQGTSEFHHVVSNPGYSGLRRRSYPRDDFDVQVVRVRTAPLDTLVPPEVKLDFIKIDVEGAELQVLRGARRILRTQRPCILFEHGKGAAEHYGTTPAMIHDFLVPECGMRIWTLRGFLAGAPPLDRAAFAAEFGGPNLNFVAR
jgi:FkbM family methyltransferase